MSDEFYRSNKLTAPLEYYIQDCSSFDEFEKRFSQEFLDGDDRVGRYLRELLDKYELKVSVVSEKAHFHSSYVGNIINDPHKKPSRDALIRICLAIGTTVEEVQYLLKYAGYAPLYVRRRRDVIIWFGFMNGESINTINDNLTTRNLPLLS